MIKFDKNVIYYIDYYFKFLKENVIYAAAYIMDPRYYKMDCLNKSLEKKSIAFIQNELVENFKIKKINNEINIIEPLQKISNKSR